MRSFIAVALFACLVAVTLAECPEGWFEACDRPLSDFEVNRPRRFCKQFGYVAKRMCIIPEGVGVAANGCCVAGK